MEKLLEVKGLTKQYKRFLLEDFSFEVKKGSITGLIGINGAGKTTVIKSIAQLINYDAGEIKILGNDIKKFSDKNEKVGYVLDSSYFYENLSLKQMKAIISASYKSWDESAYIEYCDYFDLTQEQKIESLSKGMKMKYALALALSHNAELLIMDEPTSGLDPLARNGIMKILKEFVADRTKSVLFSTHITSDLEKVADNIVFLHRGKLQYSGELSQLLNEYRIVRGPLSKINGINKWLLRTIENNNSFEGLIKFDKAAFIPEEFTIEKATIEDIMLGIIENENRGN